ncbi:hypothetical protein ABXV22_25195 [Vibrio rotiferianus]|uniref:hypothetical protein n=1 Tax=Vibrio rotiferianus TaxID=190895 RepID=UPI003398FC8D
MFNRLEVLMHLLTTNEDKITTVNERIKPRLKEISLCGVVSQKMYDSGEGFDSAVFQLGDLSIDVQSDHRDLTDPILDTGITMVRVMVQFLGYTVKDTDDGVILREYGARSDDLTIESFGLDKPSDSPESDSYIFNSLTTEEITAIQNVTLKTNNGVAHLTINKTQDIGLDELALACQSILKLMKSMLLEPLSISDLAVHW